MKFQIEDLYITYVMQWALTEGILRTGGVYKENREKPFEMKLIENQNQPKNNLLISC